MQELLLKIRGGRQGVFAGFYGTSIISNSYEKKVEMDIKEHMNKDGNKGQGLSPLLCHYMLADLRKRVTSRA